MALTERHPVRVGVSRPSDPTYIGSRDSEIGAMIVETSASYLHSLGHPPAIATRAGRPVANDSERVAARQVGEAPDLDRLNLDAVEHTRQCRLRSYQEQR